MSQEFHIKPVAPIKLWTSKVSPIDMLAANLNNVFFFTFRLPKHISHAEVLQGLQTGLSHAVVEYPTILGTITDATDDSRSKILNIDPDSSVLLISKDWSSTTLRNDWPFGMYDELEELGFPPSMLPRDLLAADYAAGNGPVFTAQVNFLGSGFVLAIRTHHAAVDGFGQGVFQAAWARYTALAMSGGTLEIPQIREAQDRERVRGEIISSTEVEDAPFLRWQTTPPDIKKLLSIKRDMAVWRVSAASIAELKQMAAKDKKPEQIVSSADAYSAFIWRHILLARQAVLSGHQHAKCFVATNIRSLTDPPLSNDYLGNAVLPSPAVAEDIDTWTAETPLGTIAPLLRQAIGTYTPEVIRKVVGFLSSLKGMQHNGKTAELAVDPFDGADGGITNLSAFGWLDQQDWGPIIGNASHMRRSSQSAMAPGMVMVYPRLEDGSLEFETNLEVEATARLRQDAEFAKYIRYVAQ